MQCEDCESLGLDMKSFSTAILFISSVFLVGCAQSSYLWEQGIGQFKLLNNAVENEAILKDSKIDEGQKLKIRQIQRAKDYFYYYWGKKADPIYSKTTFLQQDAVSYLVIASKKNEIKATETCFPFMGCFPYLGFFKEDSAKEFAQKKQKEELSTYIRPVYAYSTLGHLTDSILSSFFYYDEVELTELVFHELFHTIFFVKNAVDVNENLAMHFSKAMLLEYFQYLGKEDLYTKYVESERFHEEMMDYIVDGARELNHRYETNSNSDANVVLSEYLKTTFYPEVQKKCAKYQVLEQDCRFLHQKWNNARFAAYLTYEKNADKIEAQQKKLGLSLKDYYTWIVKEYESYLQKGENLNFEEYLFVSQN